MFEDIKRYNTCGCGGGNAGTTGLFGISVVSPDMPLLSGPARIVIGVPDKMSVKIGLCWKNSIGVDQALLLDSDELALVELNNEYITVPTKG